MAKDYNISLLFSVKDDGTPELRRLSHSFKDVGKESERTGEKISKSSKKAARALREQEKARKKMEKSFQGMGAGIGKYIGLAAGAMAFRDMAKTGLEFNEAMANVGTLIPGNLKRLNELKGGVREVAQEMGISHNDLSAGLYEVVSAFGDSADTMERLKVVATGAKAGIASTSDTLNLLSQVTKEYGDESVTGMKKASDLAFATVREGQTNFSALAGSMSVVIPTAARLKVSQEELFATMATFTRGAATTPVVVTQLNAVLTSLLTPTEAMSAKFAELGIESGSAMLETHGLGKTMQMLTNNGKETNENLVAMFGNVRAGRLAMSFSGPQMEAYTSKLKKMETAAGDTAAAFNEQQNGINASGASMARMQASLADLKISFWDLASGPMATIFQSLASGAKSLSKVIQEWQGNDAHNEALISGLKGAGQKREEIDELNRARSLGYTSVAQMQSHGEYLAGAGGTAISDQVLANNAAAYEKEKAALSAKYAADTQKIDIRVSLPTDDEGNPIIVANTKNKAGGVRTTGYRPQVVE